MAIAISCTGRCRRALAGARLGCGVVAVTVAFLATGCAIRRPPAVWREAPTAEAFLAALGATPSAPAYRATLLLTFEGGYLEEDRLKINGQLIFDSPDRLRMIGSYGAFKKVFDLTVTGDRFQVYDYRERTVYRGGAFDAEAASKLGLAVRPGDLFRLLRIGGTGPLDGAEIESVALAADSLRVRFVAGGDGGGFQAGYDASVLHLTSLSRTGGSGRDFQVTYDRYFASRGRAVPGRVRVASISGDEKTVIEVRSVQIDEEIPDDRFEVELPDDVRVVDL